jgi:ABC-2 type transport system ATP-binding protein
VSSRRVTGADADDVDEVVSAPSTRAEEVADRSTHLAAAESALLRCDEVVAGYVPGVNILNGCDLYVGDGELVGIIGPNGAGKSTLLKAMFGLVTIRSGTVEVLGRPAGSAQARAGLGYLAELFRFPGWLSAAELLRFHQRLVGSDGGEAERRHLLDLVELGDAAGKRVEAMSKGMQQRLGIAQALVGSPRLLLLDEPTSALDPVGRRIVRELLEELRRRGVSVLLNSHLLSEVELICDHVAIIARGRLVKAGTPQELAGPSAVVVETGSGVRTFDGAGREDAPRIVAELVGAGEPIYRVEVRHSSLEDVYLEAVGGQTG